MELSMNGTKTGTAKTPRRFLRAAVALSLLAGCSGSAPPPAASAPKADAAKPAAPAKAPVAASTAPKAKIPSRRALLDLLRKGPLAPDATGSVRVASATIPEGAKGDVRDIYKNVAPATVIIRTARGMGTGVVIGPAGWILTNNHVIEGGEQEDFKIKVSVELGTMGKFGGMERSGKLLTAYVHKADPLRDLAIIKLVDSPKDLQVVHLSKRDPAPGEPVASLGHAGSGLVWAIKDGEVAAVGKLTTHLAQLVALECTPTEGKAGCEAKHEMLDGLKKMLDHEKPIMVVQSTCPNFPGDSGGPLVNRSNELVGLNSFGYGTDGARSTFHVHLEEIRAFLRDIPSSPAAILPDPWVDGGTEATLADTDLDGRYDVLQSSGMGGAARFFDLDQNSFATDAKPDVAEVFSKRSFDPEVVFLSTNEGSFVWYDTNNDGKFDVLHYDEDSSGMVTRAYRVGQGGKLTRDESLSEGKDIQPARMTDSALSAALGRTAQVALGALWMQPGSNFERGLPDPLWGGGRTARAYDFDGDGRPDTLDTASQYSFGYVFDADQGSFGELNKEATQKLLDEKKVDAEVTLVGQGPRMWVWYDRNDDGKFDLVLHTPRSMTGVALEAFTLGDGGQKEAAAEHVGRKILRPDLLGAPEQVSRMRRVAMRAMASYAAQLAGDGLDSFPDPASHGGPYVEFGDTSGFSKAFGAKFGWEKAILDINGPGSTALIVDVNKDSPAAGKSSAQEVLQSGKFRADFAFLHRDGVEWTYYDSDQDGRYDVVLFNSKPSTGMTERAYKVDKSGTVSFDAELANGRMIRWKLFAKKATGTQMKKLAAELFNPAAVEQ